MFCTRAVANSIDECLPVLFDVRKRDTLLETLIFSRLITSNSNRVYVGRGRASRALLAARAATTSGGGGGGGVGGGLGFG